MKRTMNAMGVALAIGVAVAGCSSSTKPGDPLVGAWRVTFGISPTGTTLAPAPLILTVTKSGTTYAAAYPTITWSVTSPPTTIDTWAPDLFSLSTDSLQLLAHDTNAPNCYFGMLGAVSGTTAAGVAGSSGTMCTPGSWTWTATKQ